MKNITVEYFAVLRETAGVANEPWQTGAATPAELFAELSGKNAFPQMQSLKVAINDEFGAMDAPLNDGDRVVFIPPVAGG